MALAAMMATRRESWSEYVQRITVGVPRKEIAEAAQIHVSGIGRWLGDVSVPRAEKVVAFARGLGQRPVEALLAAGYLNPEEIDGAFEVMRSRAELSDDELIAELSDRLRLSNRPQGGEGDDITDRLTAPDDGLQGR